MRPGLAFTLLAACSFEPGEMPPDAPVTSPDVAPDAVVPTWSIDATSKRSVPASAAEWLQVAEAHSLTVRPPSHLWLMQETTGALADVVGAVSLAPLNAPTYQNAVAEWTRRAVGTNDTAANQGFFANTLGRLDGTSYLLLVYVSIASTPSVERSVVGIGAGTDHRYVTITPASVFRASGTGVSPTTGMTNPAMSVHPVVIKLHPAEQDYVVYTDQERLPVAWTATTGTNDLLMIGNATIGAANARYLYGALWIGPDAQLDDIGVKQLLLALGWAVSGY